MTVSKFASAIATLTRAIARLGSAIHNKGLSVVAYAAGIEARAARQKRDHMAKITLDAQQYLTNCNRQLAEDNRAVAAANRNYSATLGAVELERRNLYV